MLRIWIKEESGMKRHAAKEKKQGEVGEKIFIPKKSISSEKLSELALIIDTGGIYKGEEEANRINKALYEE